MADIIVALPKLDDAKKLKKLLIQNGYDVRAACDSGAQAIDIANCLDGGVVISGYRFSDMYCMEVNEYLPKGFEMLLLASPSKLEECGGQMVCVAMPFQVRDLLGTLEMMLAQYSRWRKRQKSRPKPRSDEDEKIIAAAKALLMERNHMTEGEAHYYIRKQSMDHSMKLIEAAIMILEGV